MGTIYPERTLSPEISVANPDELAMNRATVAIRYHATVNGPHFGGRLPIYTWSAGAISLIGFGLLAIAARRTAAFEIDIRFARWLQEFDWRVIRWATDLSNWAMGGVPLTIGAIAVAIVLLWRRLPGDAALLAIASSFRLINGQLKELIESPRPPPDLVRISDHTDGYGFPSGHAAGALLVVGAIAWIAARHLRDPFNRRRIWLAAGFWIGLAGIGRIYAGAHWPTDVIGAWLWSGPALGLLLWIASSQLPAPRYRRGRIIR